jgi:hypothetical protein
LCVSKELPLHFISLSETARTPSPKARYAGIVLAVRNYFLSTSPYVTPGRTGECHEWKKREAMILCCGSGITEVT